MNKTILIHAVWLLVSICAFAIGGKVLSKKSEPVEVVSSSKEKLSALNGDPSGSVPAPVGLLDEKSEVTLSYEAILRDFSNGGDPAAFIEAFLNEGDALAANKMFADLLLNLDKENAREIFDALRESGRADENYGRDMGLFLQAWGRLDGASAVAAVGELGGDGRRRAMGSMAAMEGWASADTAAAKEHIAGAEDGWTKGMMTQGLIRGMARIDPDEATEYVLELEAAREAEGAGNGDDRYRRYAVDGRMEAIADAQMRLGSDVATAWAEGLPDGDLKEAAFDKVVEGMVKTDPESAAKWVEAHASADYAQRAVREIAEEFSRADPVSAVEWAENLPEESKGAALSETLERWTRDDPEAASVYLVDMEESPARDSAVRSFARQLDREDPQMAAQWAATISDEGQRLDTLESVGSSWMRTDREGAIEWLPTSGLSEEAQQKVINSAEQDRDRRR